MLGVALAAHFVDGLVTRQVLWLLFWAFPGTLAGAWLGAFTYRRLSDHLFNQFILCLLGFSGLTLLWPFIFGK